MKTFSAALIAAILTIGVLPVAAATAPTVNKTWVSSTGADTGSCQLVAPCKSFAYAISQTNAGGEIDVKDSGAYGAFTISKDITIVAAGVVASVGIGPHQNAIEIGTDNVKVDIVGLTLNTHSLQQSAGIAVSCNQCVISLDHMNIQGNFIGVAVGRVGAMLITNSHISSNNNGIEGSVGVAPIFIGNNVITLNAVGISSGSIYSYGTNQINGNTAHDVGSDAVITSVAQR